MNYSDLYVRLIQSRKNRDLNKQIGYEIHHIMPKCLGGTDQEENLVKLTYREHYLAHWILTKIYTKEPKIYYGFLCMLRDPSNNRKLTSKMVETIKNNFSNFKKWHINISNPGKTLNSRSAAKKRMNSDKNPIKEAPHKNHTAKKVFVEYTDGNKKTFLMKKELADELEQRTNLTKNAIRYRIIKNDLQEFGYKNIILEIKENKPSISCIGRKWFNNGERNIFCFPGEQPDGFKLGLLRIKYGKEKTKTD